MAASFGDAFINIGQGLMDRNARARELEQQRKMQLEDRDYEYNLRMKLAEQEAKAKEALEAKKAALKQMDKLSKQTVVPVGKNSYVVQGYIKDENDNIVPYIDDSNIRETPEKPTRGIPFVTADQRIVMLDPYARGDTGLMAAPKSTARTPEQTLSLEDQKAKQRERLNIQLELKAVDSMSAAEVAKDLNTDIRRLKPDQVEEYKTGRRKTLQEQLKFLEQQQIPSSQPSWLSNAFGGLLGTASPTQDATDDLAVQAATTGEVQAPPGVRFEFSPSGEENKKVLEATIISIRKEAADAGKPISRAAAERLAREELGI